MNITKFIKNSLWVYGTCNNKPARKHKIKGKVQFVLWKAGEQGHDSDYWFTFDKQWWVYFEPVVYVYCCKSCGQPTNYNGDPLSIDDLPDDFDKVWMTDGWCCVYKKK